MKPADLYARTPKEVWKDIWVLGGSRYHHVPELEAIWSCLELTKNDRVEIRVYGHVNYDGRRFWLLAGVYIDGRPVMVIQNAGREGDDHHGRFVTDPVAYYDMVRYLGGLAGKDKYKELEFVAADQDIEGLDDFYGENLAGHTYRW